jgi:hypothetical protein
MRLRNCLLLLVLIACLGGCVKIEPTIGPVGTIVTLSATTPIFPAERGLCVLTVGDIRPRGCLDNWTANSVQIQIPKGLGIGTYPVTLDCGDSKKDIGNFIVTPGGVGGEFKEYLFYTYVLSAFLLSYSDNPEIEDLYYASTEAYNHASTYWSPTRLAELDQLIITHGFMQELHQGLLAYQSWREACISTLASYSVDLPPMAPQMIEAMAVPTVVVTALRSISYVLTATAASVPHPWVVATLVPLAIAVENIADDLAAGIDTNAPLVTIISAPSQILAGTTVFLSVKADDGALGGYITGIDTIEVATSHSSAIAFVEGFSPCPNCLIGPPDVNFQVGVTLAATTPLLQGVTLNVTINVKDKSGRLRSITKGILVTKITQHAPVVSTLTMDPDMCMAFISGLLEVRWGVIDLDGDLRDFKVELFGSPMSSSKIFTYTPAQVGISSTSKVLQTAHVHIDSNSLYLNRAGLVTVRVTAYDNLGQSGAISNGLRVWDMISNMWFVHTYSDFWYAYGDSYQGWELFSDGKCQTWYYNEDEDYYGERTQIACTWSRTGSDLHVRVDPFTLYYFTCGIEVFFDGSITGVCNNQWNQAGYLQWFADLDGWVDNDEPL